MTKIFKICLILALFFTSASVAWAGLNYDSARNYFLIDSLLKPGGNYFLVGSAFGEIPKSFAVSNNLVFWTDNSFFTDTDNVRQMGVSGGKSFLKTNQILVKSNNAFQIVPLTSGASLILEADKIKMNQNFMINNGLSFGATTALSSGYIEVERVLANALEVLDADDFIIPGDTKLTIASGGTASAGSIKIGDKNFCQIFNWTVINNSTADKITKGAPWAIIGGDQKNDLLCPANGGEPTGGTSAYIYAQKTCCPVGYYIFNLDLDVDTGKMVCCQAP